MVPLLGEALAELGDEDLGLHAHGCLRVSPE
jgi:hypothetical protein